MKLNPVRAMIIVSMVIIFLYVLGLFLPIIKNTKKPWGYHEVSPDPNSVTNRINDGYRFIAFGVDFLFFSTICEDKISLVLVPTAGSFMTFTKDWYPSSETIKRAIKGNALAKKINVPLIISGGSNDISTPPESILVSNLIENNTNIFLELKSRNTFETSRNLKAFLMKNNIKSDHYILLVTSSIHNLRTILTLKSFGYNVKIQNEYDYLSMSIWDIFPDARSLGFWNAALYEYMGIIKYIINGNINLKALRL